MAFALVCNRSHLELLSPFMENIFFSLFSRSAGLEPCAMEHDSALAVALVGKNGGGSVIFLLS